MNMYLMSEVSLVFLFYRFNKREDDFPSLREYNDYLEEVEDMSMLFQYGYSISLPRIIFDQKILYCSF